MSNVGIATLEHIDMKRKVAFFCLALSLCNAAIGQSADREKRVERIIANYLGEPVSVDSSIVQEPIALARSLNPSVKEETWRLIAQELAISLQKVMTGKGSPSYDSLSVALEGLSDKEIQQLDSLVAQPVYRKFQKAMNSPAARDALVQGVYPSGHSAEEAARAVLRKHGLKY